MDMRALEATISKALVIGQPVPLTTGAFPRAFPSA